MLVASESDRRRFRRFCENGEQCECRSRAELEHTDLPDRNLAFRGSVVTRFAGEPLCIECDQVSSVTKERLREASPGEAASKIAAPAGLAHRISSVPQSQTGAGLSACAASR
jgi:hypothetical protein